MHQRMTGCMPLRTLHPYTTQQLRRSVIDITPKMLTQTLRELEENELIQRKVYREVPPRVEYTLTDTGTKMIPFIKLLREWGDRQMAKANIPSFAGQESDENNIACHN
jgi:DNA-binding HxlR family transcriptional regulator